MAENFKPIETADQLRKAAHSEIHDNSMQGALLDTYAKLDKNQLKAVAADLEATNVTLGTAPSAEIHRVNGEVGGVTFTPGTLDFAQHAHTLNLINEDHMVIFEKSGNGPTTVSGKENPDTSSKYTTDQSIKTSSPAMFKENPLPAVGSLDKVAESTIGALVGKGMRFESTPIVPPIGLNNAADGLLDLPSYNKAVEPSKFNFEELNTEGSRLRGIAVGGGIEVAELGAYNALKDNHKLLADMVKPSGIEAILVGAAASAGASNMKLRLGLIGGAMLAGKVANIAINEYEYLTQK